MIADELGARDGARDVTATGSGPPVLGPDAVALDAAAVDAAVVREAAAVAVEIDEASAAFLLTVGAGTDEVTDRISGPQLRALLVLERSQPVKLGQLAAALGTIPSSASRLCDRLQAAGLIERRIGEPDRRAIRLELTPQAISLLERLRTRRRTRLDAVLRLMPPDGRTALLNGLRQFTDAAALVVAGRPAGGSGAPLSG